MPSAKGFTADQFLLSRFLVFGAGVKRKQNLTETAVLAVTSLVLRTIRNIRFDQQPFS